MKCISFNVNSVRIRLHQLQAVIERHAPDFIGLQETKVTDEDFPIDDINALGYHVAYIGQKTHYGVALLSKHPFQTIIKGFDTDTEEDQKRFIGGTFDLGGKKITVLNGYFPQGESRDHPVKFPNKRRFYGNLLKHLANNHKPDDALIVMGDMNISHQDIDIGIGEDNRKRWLQTGKCSFLPEEREWLKSVMDWGLYDTYRTLKPESNQYFSWFDYRSKGFECEPKRGLRIDLILASDFLNKRCVDVGIDYDVRGMDRSSDHCPVFSEFKL
jgi:exodeoxyribonuclease III